MALPRNIKVLLTVIPGSTAALKGALKGVAADIDARQKQVEKFKAALASPGVIKYQAKQAAEQDRLAREFCKTFAVERARQSGFLGTGIGGRAGYGLGEALKGAGTGAVTGGLIGALSGQGGFARAGLGAVGGAVGGAAGGPAGAVAGAAIANVGSDVLTGLIGQVQTLTGAANPATLRLFNIALADISGVLGRFTIPFTELFTKYLRLYGDVLATILPSTDEVRDALAPLNDTLDDFRDVLAEIAPLLKGVVSGLLKSFAETLKYAVFPLRVVVEVLRQLGIIGGKARLDTSQGAAAMNVQTTSAADFHMALLKAGMEAGQNRADPARDAADAAREAVRELKNIRAIAGDILTVIEWVRTHLPLGFLGGAIAGPVGGAFFGGGKGPRFQSYENAVKEAIYGMPIA